MSVSYVGSAVANVTANATSITVSAGLPTILANDIAIIIAGSQFATAKTFPTGFTSTFSGITQLVPSSGAGQNVADLRYGFCVGGESSFTVSGGNCLWSAIVLIFRGVNTTTPLDTSVQTAITGSNHAFNISATCTAGTSPVSGSAVILVTPIGEFQSGTPAISIGTPPSGFSNETHNGSTTNSVPTLATCNEPNYGGGSLGATLSFTISGPTGGGQSTDYGSWLFSLAPAPLSFVPYPPMLQGGIGVQMAQ